MAIIIMLMATLLPVFEQATKHAESATCLSNLRSLPLAAQMYASDWDDFLPPALVPARPVGYAVCWDVTLTPYLRNQELLVCTSDPNPTPGPSWTYSYPHSYGINLSLTMVGGYQGQARRLGDLEEPGRVILYFELAQPYSYGWQSSWANLAQYVAARHHNGANFAFCGGNARWLPLERTMEGAGMWEP
ncbi:MAG TPA: hypothetical protein VGM19_10325 [Armatimonadota bacterium]